MQVPLPASVKYIIIWQQYSVNFSVVFKRC